MPTLEELNCLIEAKCRERDEGHDVEDEILALEHEAAGLIQAKADATLGPIKERFDAALREALRLLGDHDDEGDP